MTTINRRRLKNIAAVAVTKDSLLAVQQLRSYHGPLGQRKALRIPKDHLRRNNNGFALFSPDGKRIAYRTMGPEGGGLRIMNLDNGHIGAVTDGSITFRFGLLAEI